MHFKDLSIVPEITLALEQAGITQPTPIQAEVIPLLVASKRIDIHGQAETGTGKTFAFGIPLVQSIDPSSPDVQGLIVAPTRELAIQISQSLRVIAQPLGIVITSVYGGASLYEQIKSFERGSQIIVGTPGRLNDHLNRKTLSLRHLKTLVLDEADIMLDMGFKDEIDEILNFLPSERNIWLFSATVKKGIYQLIKTHMRNVITVKVAAQEKKAASVKQYFSVIPSRDRLVALTRFVDAADEFYGLVFCQTKVLTEEVAEHLIRAGYPAHALHGDMTQIQRNRIIRQFKNKEFTLLVATDVAARGIDIAELTHVINYSLPEDQESYVHRIGRTGRAGRSGTAITFVTRNEVRYLQLIERKFDFAIRPLDVPSRQDIKKTRLTQVSRYIQERNDEGGAVDTDITALVRAYNESELKSIVAHLIKDRFFKCDGGENVAFAPVTTLDFAELAKERGQTEVTVFAGLDDGITRQDVLAFIKEGSQINNLDLDEHAVRVIKKRTFIKLPLAHAEMLVQELKDKKLQGKRFKVALSVDYGRSGKRPGFGGGPHSRRDSFSTRRHHGARWQG